MGGAEVSVLLGRAQSYSPSGEQEDVMVARAGICGRCYGEYTHGSPLLSYPSPSTPTHPLFRLSLSIASPPSPPSPHLFHFHFSFLVLEYLFLIPPCSPTPIFSLHSPTIGYSPSISCFNIRSPFLTPSIQAMPGMLAQLNAQTVSGKTINRKQAGGNNNECMNEIY